MRYLHIPWLIVLVSALSGCAGGMAGKAAMADWNETAQAPPPSPAADLKVDPSGGLGGFGDDGTEGDRYRTEPGVATDTDTNQPVKAGADVPSKPAAGQRLIIYRAEMGVYVFDVEQSLAEAAALTKANQGWVQQSTNTSLLLRVPVGQFDALVEALSGLGDVHTQNVVGTDVSEEFFDLQIRLRNAEALRERYLKLLNEAKTVKDSLAIEKELARITEEIERFKGRIRFLKDQGTYSTVGVRFDQKPDQPIRPRTNLPFSWLREYSLDYVY